MLYPFLFHPTFKERIWGGRNLERLYKKQLPPEISIGESWEISDRPGDESLIANGPLTGKSLRWLMKEHGNELLGAANPTAAGRFPLLIKILDAQEKLSLQVHPPAAKAKQLGGEPKTEMWYIADATADAHLFVGLKRGTTQSDFEKRIENGTVAECFSKVPTKKGDVMFLPSGRVHAIGAGNVIFEIQENSDTTYRVFDWNRLDDAGKPRQLHIEKSIASIDFDDFEPSLVSNQAVEKDGVWQRVLVADVSFTVDSFQPTEVTTIPLARETMQIIAVLEGEVSVIDNQNKINLMAGQFCLVPASAKDVSIAAGPQSAFLKIFCA